MLGEGKTDGCPVGVGFGFGFGLYTYREQQLRERIIKMATRNKEKTRKFEATIRSLMDENETLKRRMAELEKVLLVKRT